MLKHLTSVVKWYYISATAIGGTYGYLEHRKELGPDNIMPITILYAGVGPYIPFMYAYENWIAKEKKFDIKGLHK